MEAKEMAKLAVAALEEKKAVDVKVIDIEKISTLADYFIIASGTNRSQVQAMAEAVEEELQKQDIHPKNVEGYQSANWILMDYGDFIIHLFDKESREYYNLERIWRDAKFIEVQDFLA